MTTHSSEIHFSSGDSHREFGDYKPLNRNGYFVTGTVVNYGQLRFVKSLIPECRELSDCRRILQKEYEILAGLNSRSIVRVFSLREVPGAGLSIIMEFVEGATLDEYLPTAGAHQRKRVARSLVNAVAGLHAKGVTHLDLKPQNIMVRGSYEDPEVVIIDFNLSDAGVFQYNKEVGGTRDYAAPEQFDAGYVASPTADVWSLGKLLTEIAPGRSWNAAIHRALRDEPEERAADASALLAIERNSRRRTLLTAVAVGALLLALIPLSLWLATPAPTADSLADNQVKSKVNNSLSEGLVSPDSTIILENPMTPPAVQPAEASSLPTLPSLSAPSPSQQPKGNFETYEREHDRLMKIMHKIYAEGMEDMKKTANDLTVPLDERVAAFGLITRELNKKLISTISNFRASCPQELLAKHSDDWGTFYDNDLEDDFNNYKALVRTVGEQFMKEQKEQEDKNREARRRRISTE